MQTETSPVIEEKRGTISAGVLPPFTVGELPPPPPGGWRRWLSVVGPGVLLAGASIGSGEWLTGPAVTAQYGATLLWLATLSIIGQVFVNLEMIRYTLYCGEPIIVGYFRSWPGPRLWTICYALLDFAAIWPFNVAGAAGALAAALLGHLPGDATVAGTAVSEKGLVQVLSYALFLAAFVPLIFGGTIYRMLLRIFTFKLAVVLVYLTFFVVLTVSARNVWQVCKGFFRFGEIPVRADTVIADRHFAITERAEGFTYVLKGTVEDGRTSVIEFTARHEQQSTSGLEPERFRARMLALAEEHAKPGRFFVQDSYRDVAITIEGEVLADQSWQMARVSMQSKDGIRRYEGASLIKGVPEPFAEHVRILVENQGLAPVGIMAYWREHGRLPQLNWMLLATLAAIAGAGGLSNTLYSSFARDKGWGMGARVGAIPSLVGGRTITLSHVGEAFKPDEKSRPRWRRWMRYIVEDQIVVWMLCQFIGMALPCMLSMEFIRHAPVEGNRVAAMTAEGMAHRFPGMGQFLFLLTLFIAFLILYPGQILSGDQLARRWTEIIWASNPQAQRLHGNQVKYVYYGILSLYAVWGLIALWLFNPLRILVIGGTLMNVAMGFSALHTLYVNRTLLPRELQPNWFMQAGVLFCGIFFLGLTAVVLWQLWI
jgi:hypothetical protein